MDSYEAIKADLMQHVRHLCVELGPRPRGSPASHATAAYIRGGFETAGLDVDEQTFQCPLWEHESTLLDLNGTTVEAAANPFQRYSSAGDERIEAAVKCDLWLAG